MKGLIVKDILVLKRYLLIFLGFFVAYSFFTLLVMQDSASLIGFMIVIASIILAVTSFAYDDQAKWWRYCTALPVTATQVIASKYILMIFLGLSGAIVSFLLIYSANLIQSTVFSVEETLLQTLYLLCIAWLLISFFIPLIIKFGTEKARFIILLIALLPIILSTLLKENTPYFPSEEKMNAVLGYLPVISPCALLISCMISCKIYRKKCRS